jgi:hypothetical protein
VSAEQRFFCLLHVAAFWRHNARINPPDNNIASAKFSMRAMLTPVGFNELLCTDDFVQPFNDVF